MARYLLDIHVFLWWISDAKQLSKEVFEIVADTGNEIYISAASIWEIAIKEALGKLEIDADLDRVIEENGFTELKVSAASASQTKKLEPIHRDPFDRMLIAQAMVNDLTLITVDKNITRYKDVKILHFQKQTKRESSS